MKPSELPSPAEEWPGNKSRIAVPGLWKVVEDLRRVYPELTEEAVARILRLPPRAPRRPDPIREN